MKYKTRKAMYDDFTGFIFLRKKLALNLLNKTMLFCSR